MILSRMRPIFKLVFVKSTLLFILILFFIFLLTSKSRIGADDYCNAKRVHYDGFFRYIADHYPSNIMGSTLTLIASNFSLVNWLPANFSAVYLITAYVLFFTIISILIRLILNLNYDLSFIPSLVLVLLLLLVTSGQGTNAGGFFYNISWQAASVSHLLPGILILITILFWVQASTQLDLVKYKGLFVFSSLILTFIIANSHFMWSTSFFIVLSYLLFIFIKERKLTFFTRTLLVCLSLLAANLIIVFYFQITSDRYQNVGRELESISTSLYTFFNIGIHNLWLIINNYSLLIGYLLGMLFYKFYAISFDSKNKKLVLVIRTTLLFIFSSLIMVSLGELIAYQAAWHMLASIFISNFFAFFVGWFSAESVKIILNRWVYFFLTITPLFISLYFILDAADSRLEKWNEYEPAPYGVMTDLDSDWVLSCSDAILQLPINKRG